uniref:KIB1-4 beta-propeller domain-containing protein n=1 Tax=Aegilops tauschii TaxID=37682 RepID=N1QQH9_AEGTA
MASSLPADVVRRLGDLFLDTDDVDYYMTMRGVCHGWRVSTDDPKTSPADPRFRLGRWVMLDERRPKSAEEELLDDGPLPDTAYTAKLDAEQFAVEEYNLVDKVRTIWGIDAADQEMIGGLMRSITAVLPYKMYFLYTCYHILESAGDMLIVIHRQHPRHGVDVFKVNVEEKAVEPVRSIGSRALFLGQRCVSVDTNKFSTIEGNRVFYFGGGEQYDKGIGIYMFDLTNETEKWITSDVHDFSLGFGEHTKPTMIQTLMKYCIDTPWVPTGV